MLLRKNIARLIYLILIIAFFIFSPVFGETYESISLLNSKNLASYFPDLLGFLYDSHGCLHFTPSDIYLLTKTIPINSKLTIKTYNQNTLTDAYNNAPIFHDVINSESDIQIYKKIFASEQIELVVYPSLGKLFILINGAPKFQITTLAGPPQYYRQVLEIQNGGPIRWDPNLNTPTDYGIYKIFGVTSHYISPTYYDSTILPFGAQIAMYQGSWAFQEENVWYTLPRFIVEDLSLSSNLRQYNYYDVVEKDGKVVSARWASHDFGKDALLWTLDGKARYPELGYAEGELLLEQVNLAKDLAYLLTVLGSDEFESCIAKNDNFLIYKDSYDFVKSNGSVQSDKLDPLACGYYRLFNNIKLTDDDIQNIDQRLINAFNDYRSGNLPWLPWEKEKKEQTIGLYYYLRDFNFSFLKQAHYYKKISDDWSYWLNIRIKLRDDFDNMGIYSAENRQMFVERWLNDRLEFKTIRAPKISTKISFTSFFTQEAETTLFTEREKEVLREFIRKSASGEAMKLQMKSVDALNQYNFGVLINEMLGNLYKSHGCLHVSPRNIYLLNTLLPVGARVTIKGYSEKVEEKDYEKLPMLVQMVNFNEDLAEMAKLFADPKDVKLVVYPGAKVWIVYIKDIPFARASVEPGPQSKVKILIKRDKNGKPIFEKEIAYPSTPGNYFIFKKVDNYVSKLYYDLTVIPQDSTIIKDKDKWVFVDEAGKIKDLPRTLNNDISLPSDQREYTYYDRVKDDKGKLVSAKWGDNPFGRYPVVTSIDMKMQSPELIHTSGDLMMEQRQLISDLIQVLSAPKDKFEDCIQYSKKFDMYSTCYKFVMDPTSEAILEDVEAGSYKLYQNLPLTSREAAAIPRDVFIAYKLANTSEKLTKDEIALLVKEGVAEWRGGGLNVDKAKIYGILYDVYQYVVAIRKNANIYSTLQTHWDELSAMRKALFLDFKTFIIKDPIIFNDFTSALTLKRVNMERLTQQDAFIMLENILKEKGL